MLEFVERIKFIYYLQKLTIMIVWNKFKSIYFIFYFFILGISLKISIIKNYKERNDEYRI